jgi:tetratricopeptide (TPR) repeat protein
LKPNRKSWFVALVAVAALAAAWAGWRCGRTILLVRMALPAHLDLANKPAALVHELDSAVEASRRFIGPIDGLARFAQLCQANGYYDEALSGYRALARLQPSEPRWPHLIANIDATYGRIAEAIPLEQRVVQLAPNLAIARLRLADMLFKANRLPEAESEYQALLQIDPANAYALFGLARCRERAHDEPGARELLRRAVAVQPGFSSAWALLASMETARGNQDAAESARKRSEVRFHDMEDPWVDGLMDYCYDAYQLSVAADVSKDRNRARELLARAVAVAPEVSSYRRELAKILLARGEKTFAREQLEKAVALSPDDSESWSALITLFLEINDRRAGFEALAKALQFCPQSGYLHYLNGDRLMALSRLDEAEKEFQTAKRLQPAEVRAYVKLSVIYVMTGRVRDAMEEAKGAHAADPANPATLNMLARLSIMLDDPAAAADWIRKIRSSPQPNPEDLAQLIALFRQQFGRDPI